jgi:glucose-6-phosphate isomerase
MLQFGLDFTQARYTFMLVSDTKAWQELQQHKQQLDSVKLSTMFALNPQRFADFTVQLPGILLDYSKQRITAETIELLCKLASEAKLQQAIENLFSGEIVNKTENRPALHTELRKPNPAKIEVKQVLAQMRKFVAFMHKSKFTDVIVLGIGGSDLGPRLVCEALAPYTVSKLRMHFVANVDGDTVASLLQGLNPQTTLCIINSKTFTTIETLANAQLIKDWLLGGIEQQHLSEHLIAVTANKELAINFGIAAAQIFEFWDWVGGRYSVWSAVGLPIALTIGMDNFERFLAGAHAMDQHFRTANLAQNMPVLMALLGIWNINFNGHATLAIKPYADSLQLLPPYLQQLEMESNGKSAANSGGFVPYQTAPVIWGGVGCNGQHAYMQLLHQGTQVIPVDFLVAKKSINGPAELHNLLVASCLGQSQALMAGCADDLYYKTCPGDRPSTTIMFDQLTPEILGSLIALYEHKVYVQGIIWQIQSFDKWGVQLGKVLIKDVLQLMQSDDLANVDSSTAGLLNHFADRN